MSGNFWHPSGMQINRNHEPGVFAALDAPATVFHPFGMGTADFAILRDGRGSLSSSGGIFAGSGILHAVGSYRSHFRRLLFFRGDGHAERRGRSLLGRRVINAPDLLVRLGVFPGRQVESNPGVRGLGTLIISRPGGLASRRFAVIRVPPPVKYVLAVLNRDDRRAAIVPI